MPKCFLCIFFIIFILTGCKTDFQVNDPWKEVNVIYGLMSAKDSVLISYINPVDYTFNTAPQYFFITKLFSNNNGNANTIATIPDSLYNKNWVVTLYEMNGSTVVNSYILDTTTSIPRDPGIFAYPHQVIYKTPNGIPAGAPGKQKFVFHDSSSYKIEVYDTKTGIKSTASANCVQKATPIGNSPSGLRFVKGQGHLIRWNAGANARYYEIVYTIHYYEYPVNNPSAKVEKTLQWIVLKNYLTSSLSGGSPMDYSVDGSAFFNFLAGSLSVDPNISRQMIGIEVSILGGGEDLYTYTQVNSPSLGIVQKKTDYTNVTNGYGIFSSRSETKYFLQVDNVTIDTLISKPPTNTLGFK